MAQTKAQQVATTYNHRIFQLKGVESSLSHYSWDSPDSSEFSHAIYEQEQEIIRRVKELQLLYKLHRDSVIKKVKSD